MPKEGKKKKKFTLPPRAAERYSGLKRLGLGGMGEVFRALDLRLQREVALKVIRMDAGEKDKSTERLRREAKALATLRHPNVVRLLDFDEEGGVAFLAMEFVDGLPLSKVIEETGKLSSKRAAAIGAAVAEGLYAAHERGIIHRDIKPDNILISNEGIPVVADFGLAKGAEADDDPSLTKTGHFVGTPKFVPPEVITGAPFCATSDLYQLGLVLYQMLTGIHPLAEADFLSVARGTALKDVQPPSMLNEQVDKKLDDIIMSLIAKDVKKRPQTGKSLARALNDWRQGENKGGNAKGKAAAGQDKAAVVKSKDGNKTKRIKRKAKHRQLMLFTASLTGFFVLGLLVILLMTRKTQPTSISGFVMPKGLRWHGRRGKLIPIWTNKGDAFEIELRETSEKDWRIMPMESSLSGLKPGNRYRVRFRSVDGRLSPSQTVTVPYSALKFQALTSNDIKEEIVTATLRSQIPLLVSAKWKQNNQRYYFNCSKKPSTNHELDFNLSHGLFDSLQLKVKDQKANMWTAALPAASLAEAILGKLKAISHLKLIDDLSERSFKDRTRGGDLHGSLVAKGLDVITNTPSVKAFLQIRPFAPLVLADKGLPLEERAKLYRNLNNLLPLDRFFEVYGRRLPFNVEALVSPFSHLSKEVYEGGLVLGKWPAGFLLELTEGNQQQASKSTVVTLNFTVPPGLLRKAKNAFLCTNTNLYSYRVALQANLNDKLDLNYHFRPHRVHISHFVSGGGDKAQVNRVRSFNPHYLSQGENVLRLQIKSLLGHRQRATIQLKELRLLLIGQNDKIIR